MEPRYFVETLLLIAILAINLSQVNGANILFFFGLSTPSHTFSVWPLVEKLADRGHKVTFFQPFKNSKPNPKVIQLATDEDISDTMSVDKDFLGMRLVHGMMGNIQHLVLQLPYYGTGMCEKFLSDVKVQSWLKDKNTKFDIIFSDAVYNDCALGLVHIFKAKHAIFGTTHPFNWWTDSYGIPSETNWIPDNHMTFPLPLNFLERLLSTLTPFYYFYQKRFIMYPKLERMYKEILGMDMPSFDEIDRNSTSLILMNTHFSEELARSLPPFVIPIGGMHCGTSNNNPLPKDMAKFIDESGNTPIIYVSFGSAVSFAYASEELRNIFLGAFKNSKCRILWKWDGDRPKDMAKNIFTSAWMPQDDILAHPKVRAFITHGGLLGMHEAIYHAVPMIALPLFAEQDYNSNRLAFTGRGIAIDVAELTQKILEDAMHEILTNPSYRKNMEIASKRFKDRPEKPVDTAVWWTEYVLRHEDTSFLLPQIRHQYWFQRRLLDVWGALLVLVAIIVGISLCVTKCILQRIFGSKKERSISTKSAVKASKKQKNKQS